jgi:outer membrane immunogenic protein
MRFTAVGPDERARCGVRLFVILGALSFMKIVSIPMIALAGCAALAAGVACAQPMDAPPPGTVDWNGVYVGANGGWRGADTRVDPSTASVNQLSGVSAGNGPITVPSATYGVNGQHLHSSTGAVGGQIGFNVQKGNLVLGVEGDMDAAYGRRGETDAYGLPATALTTGSTVYMSRDVDPHWTGTLRGRVGYATGPLLLYGTGGLAMEGVTVRQGYSYAPTVTTAVAAANPTTTFGPYFNGESRDLSRVGWTAGAGAEMAISPHLSVGAEYRHSDYGHEFVGIGSNAPNTVSNGTRIDFTDDAVLAKINYRFGSNLR